MQIYALQKCKYGNFQKLWEIDFEVFTAMRFRISEKYSQKLIAISKNGLCLFYVAELWK